MRSERKTRKTVVIAVVCLLLAIQSMSLAKASISRCISDLTPRTLPPTVPPLYPGGEPPPIPDSPFIDNLVSKYSYLLMWTEAYGSSPRSFRWNPKADFNSDGVVDILDLIVLLDS